MKLSEKNVLVGTGILFVIVFVMFKLGDHDATDPLNLKITSSSYDLDKGKLRLEFRQPHAELDSFYITITDENNNLVSGKTKLEDKNYVFDTFIPQLNFKNTLEIIIENEASSKKMKIEHKIPEDNIIAVISTEEAGINESNLANIVISI